MIIMDFEVSALYLLVLVLSGAILLIPKASKIWHVLSKRKSSQGSFPGPTQLPLIGRVHDLPRFGMWLKFKEWADQYGPIYKTSMMGDKFLIVSDEAIATELLIKNGNNYSGRAQITAVVDHRLGPMYEALQDRNDCWKKQRKWVHAAMAAAYQKDFHGHIEREVKRFLVTLLVDPEKFHANTREMTGRIISTLSWDNAPQGKRNGDEALETLSQMSIPTQVANLLPHVYHFLDLICFNPWRNAEVKRQAKQREWWLDNLRRSKTRFLRGDLPSDTWAYRYCKELTSSGNVTLEQGEKEETFAACMLGFQCLVGVVTLSGPLQFFWMSMALHPEWVAKAQQEIDRVCGDRMPDLRDYENLPTVRACIKETLRWRSGVPLGVPHRAERDGEYRGVKIEKDTIILACEWAINRVPEKYPDPENFHPERWLEPGWPTFMEPLTRYPNLREGHGMHTFGWGRRTCLGQGMADKETFLVAAAVCWGFNMDLKKDSNTGEDIACQTQATNCIVISEPLPFPMEFRPRSEERARLMTEQYSSIRSSLKV